MAVFTNLLPDDFKHILTDYNIGEYVSHAGITDGIENTNYILTTTQDKFIFTIYENRTNLNDLPFFLKLKEELNKNNFSCPMPVKDKNNNLFSQFNGKYFAIISFLNGANTKNPNIKQIASAAQKLAKMHNLSAKITNIKRDNSLSVNFWIDTYSKIKVKAEAEFSGLKDLMDKGLNLVLNNWPNNLPNGIIHGDYFPDNVIFNSENQVTGVIDFYMAANDILAYDLAIMINAWCFENDFSLNKQKLKTLFDNYNKIRNLNEKELELLPILLVGASIRFLTTRLYDYFNTKPNSEVKIKDPKEYITKLKLHLAIKNLNEYDI